jgi:hypothetical protein
MNTENLTIEQLSDRAWLDYAPTDEVVVKLDELTDKQYSLCGDMYAEGFKAGVAYILAMGKPND